MDRFTRVAWLAAMIVVALAGCGGDEPFERYEITGQVSYQGKPVENGSIVFEPQASAGNLAPTAYGKIEGGEFTTPKEQGPTKGAYLVRVNGVDHSKMKPAAAPGEPVETPALFPEHRFEVEIPPPDNRLEIVVPADSDAGAKQ
jgi:hypothetical protein